MTATVSHREMFPRGAVPALLIFHLLATGAWRTVREANGVDAHWAFGPVR